MMRRGSLGLGVGLVATLILVGSCSVGHFEMEDGQKRSRSVRLSMGDVLIGRNCQIKGDIHVQAGQVKIQSHSRITGDIVVKHGNVSLGDSVQVRSLNVSSGTIDLGQAFLG